jgi:hypothetical protein
MAKRCMVCGGKTEMDFVEFCDSCFELDLDDLMKKFLEFRQKEGIRTAVKADPPRLSFYVRIGRRVGRFWRI